MSKGRPPGIRSPQEKKALSLKKDRRNTYFANDKASRKLIPLQRARASRQARHAADQALATAVDMGGAALDLAESSVRQDTHRLGGWTKLPDGTLAEHIGRRTGRKKPDPAPAD